MDASANFRGYAYERERELVERRRACVGSGADKEGNVSVPAGVGVAAGPLRPDLPDTGLASLR